MLQNALSVIIAWPIPAYESEGPNKYGSWKHVLPLNTHLPEAPTTEVKRQEKPEKETKLFRNDRFFSWLINDGIVSCDKSREQAEENLKG